MALDLTIYEDKIEESFDRIANELMNNWLLKIGSKIFRIAEIEFYYKSESHNDPYTHEHVLQKEKEKWYFHGSGIDITFGANETFGGILIRAIRNIKDGNYIYGPLNCVTEIFNTIGNIHDIEKSFGLIASRENNIEIEPEIPIAAPRVGLNPLKDKTYSECYYRFLIMPKCKHAEKTKIEDAMRKQKKFSEDKIKSIWG
ncbi:MAG: hypothetical protein AB7S72_04825 [Draconibacterium sp.]